MLQFRIGRKTVAIGFSLLALLLVCLFHSNDVVLKFNLLNNTLIIRSYQVEDDTTCSGDFQVVEKDLAFAYSAYIDDRPARDTVSIRLPIVRIFTYYLRGMDPTKIWHCRFWYKNTSTPTIKPVIGITDLDDFDKLRFMPVMVLCAFPEGDNSRPHSVSLVNISSLIPSNYLCIVDLRTRRSNFLNKTLDSKYPTFTICTKAIHDGHYKVHDIVNFIEINRLFGADKFIFYADAKIANLSNKHCLDSYSKRGIAEIHPFTPPVLTSLMFHGQFVTLSECIYRAMYQTTYVISQDLDEFIVPRKFDNWHQMLADFRNRTKNPDLIGSYVFQNQFFPYLEANDTDFENDTLVNQFHITPLLQTLKLNHIWPHNIRSKFIARPENVLLAHVHYVHQKNLVGENVFPYHVHSNDSLLFHYRKWEISGKLIPDKRMHDFASQLKHSIPIGFRQCSSKV